jgi:hypothetical protein
MTSDQPARIARGPRRVRALLEAALDECGWPWCRRASLLLDELLSREDAA